MARQRPRDPVQFTRESAERIANVVRAAETAPPPASPLRFEALFQDRVPKQVRAARFSGAWPIGSTKMVTFSYTPTATANVTNLSWPITNTAYANEDCIVGKEGTNWWLVVPVLSTATAIMVTRTATALFVTQTATARFVTSSAAQSVVTGVSTTKGTINFLSDVSISASLNTTDCAITVGVTKTTGSAEIITGVEVTTGTVAAVGGFGSATVIGGTMVGIVPTQTRLDAYFRPRLT